MMNHEVAQRCVDIARNSPSLTTVDLTGGAPVLNREFRFLVKACHALGLEIIDRCNLTVLLEPHQSDLPGFLAEHQVHIIASLPCYLKSNVASQRGDQIFERSIEALRMLNSVGYGKEGTSLELDLVYNPTGLYLPPPREALEADYKRVLMEDYGISFNKLHCITNMPINRFFDYLKARGELEKYMDILVSNFNPAASANVMCHTYVSVDPYGYVFDCDFNQQLKLFLKEENTGTKPEIHVFDINCTNDLLDVRIRTKKHCFGCTAGAGSS
jgi:radical SAM/Cys-rich protein